MYFTYKKYVYYIIYLKTSCSKIKPSQAHPVLTYTDILDNNYVSCMIHEYWDSLKRDNIDLTDSNVAC